MKFVTSLVCLLAMATIQISLTKADDNKVSQEKLKEAAMIIVNDCKVKEGASDDDLAALKKHTLPKTEKGMCMVQCLFNTAKIMKNGKFYKEGAIEFCTPAMKGDETKIKKMKDVMDMCEKEIGDASGCEVARTIAECTAKHGKDFGFTIPNQLKDM